MNHKKNSDNCKERFKGRIFEVEIKSMGHLSKLSLVVRQNKSKVQNLRILGDETFGQEYDIEEV